MPQRVRRTSTNAAVFDELDEAIIQAMREDPARPNAAIARHVGSTESTVRRRREALLAQGVVRLAAVVDPFKFGYQIMALIGLHIDSSRLAEAESVLAEMPELRFVGLTLGRYDVLTEAWFHSTEDLLNFVTDRLGRVPGVQRTETIQIARLVKYGYDWGQDPRPGTSRMNT